MTAPPCERCGGDFVKDHTHIYHGEDVCDDGSGVYTYNAAWGIGVGVRALHVGIGFCTCGLVAWFAWASYFIWGPR